MGPAPTAPFAPLPAAPPLAADGWWARADRAVEDSGAAVLAAQQAIGYARRLVATAERADAADEAAWRTSPGGRVTVAPDALAALAASRLTSLGKPDAAAALLRDGSVAWLLARLHDASIPAVTGCLLGTLAGNLFAKPVVQDAVVARVTNEIFTRLDVEAVTQEALDAVAQQGLPPRVATSLPALSAPPAICSIQMSDMRK